MGPERGEKGEERVRIGEKGAERSENGGGGRERGRNRAQTRPEQLAVKGLTRARTFEPSKHLVYFLHVVVASPHSSWLSG